MINNLTLVNDLGLKSPMMPPAAHQRFRSSREWKEIRNMTFLFYSIADFVKFHLPFAQAFSSTISSFDLVGAYIYPEEDERQAYDMHTTCKVVNGRRTGCEICNVLTVLDEYLPSGPKVVERLETRASFSLNVAGTEVKVSGTFKDGLVRRLYVEGKIYLVNWGMLDSLAPESSEIEGQPAIRKDSAQEIRGEPSAVEPQLICLHDMSRLDYRHCVDERGCWEVAAVA